MNLQDLDKNAINAFNQCDDFEVVLESRFSVFPLSVLSFSIFPGPQAMATNTTSVGSDLSRCDD